MWLDGCENLSIVGLLMTFVRTSVLYVFFLIGFAGVVSPDVAVPENPYRSVVPDPYNTLGDRAESLPHPSLIEKSPTRDFLNFTSLSDYGLGGLWSSTAPLRERNIHFRSSENEFHDDSSTISSQFFIDAQTDRARVFRDLFNPYFIKNNSGDIVSNPALLEELEKISFVQENIGFMFHAHHVYRRVGLSIDLPVLVSVAHPWAPSSTRDMLAGTGDPSEEGVVSKTDIATMKKSIEKIETAGCLGDLKIAATVNHPLLGERVVGNCGLEVIIPLQSAKVAQRKLSFNPVKEDFNPSYLNLGLDQELAGKYAKRLVEYLKAIGTNPVVGQKSLSIGLSAGLKIYVHPSCTLHQSVKVHYNFPVKEYRFIHRFLEDDRSPSSLAVEPGEFLVSVSRGLVVHGTLGIRQKVIHGVTLGLSGDIFWQNSEKIREVFTDGENLVRLLPQYAEMGRAQQVAVRMSIEKKLKGDLFTSRDMRLLLDAGFAVSSSGIGKLWHLGLCVAGNF